MTTKPATQTNTQPCTDDFFIEDSIINNDYGSIADPEFSPIDKNAPDAPTCWMAYRQGRSIYVAEIDRSTGLIATKPHLITSHAAGFVRSGGQGPEWGFNDDEGLLIAYTVVDRNRRGQIKYSRPESSSLSGWSAPLDLTGHEDTLVGRIGASTSKHGKYSTQVVYREWKAAAIHTQDLWGPQQFFWMDVHDKQETLLPPGILAPSQPPQFAYPRTEIDDNRISDLIFSYMDAEQRYQIVRYDSSTPDLPESERIHYLTSVEVDGGETWDHSDPCCFIAPEYGKQLTYAASLVATPSEEDPHPSPQRIAIYTQSSTAAAADAFQPLKCRKVLEIPACASGYTVISSVEPITTEKASFLSVLLLNPEAGKTSIWLWSLNGDFYRQVSSDNYNGADPENLLGTDELYVYYTVYGAGDRQDPTDARVDLHLCKTGVGADGSYTPNTEPGN